jgi:hypothetical protein
MATAQDEFSPDEYRRVASYVLDPRAEHFERLLRSLVGPKFEVLDGHVPRNEGSEFIEVTRELPLKR